MTNAPMNVAVEAVTCPRTGLRLVPPTQRGSFRVALSSSGALVVHPKRANSSGRFQYNPNGDDILIPWDQQPAWGRWDVPGTTLYVGASRQAAFAESLQGYRQTPGMEHLAALADEMGMSLAEYVAAIEVQANHNAMMPAGQIAAGWRHARLIYSVSLPRAGWWVDIEHGETLGALDTYLRDRFAAAGLLTPLERSHVLGNNRLITLIISSHVHGLTLFDGSRPLGIVWGSKLGFGDNYALWLRHVDDGGSAVGDGVAADSGSPIRPDDPDLVAVTNAWGIHLH